MSADLVTWLRACLGEDEQVAKAAIGAPFPVGKCMGAGVWRQGVGGPYVERVEADDMVIYDEGGHDEYQAAHIARWDPARVLAEVTAKRELLAIHRPVKFTDVSLGIVDADVCFTCHVHLDEPANWDADVEWAYTLVQESWPCQTAAALAQVYADRAGFDPSWLD